MSQQAPLSKSSNLLIPLYICHSASLSLSDIAKHRPNHQPTDHTFLSTVKLKKIRQTRATFEDTNSADKQICDPIYHLENQWHLFAYYTVVIPSNRFLENNKKK
jgi:hypothetical protein